MRADQIIENARKIVVTSWTSENWLTDAEDVAIHDDGRVGLGCHTCLDGALNLASLGLTPETATLTNAVMGTAQSGGRPAAALREAKRIVREEAGELVWYNSHHSRGEILAMLDKVLGALD